MLILREQIAPFRVDFTVKETSLDFSKVKTAAFGLLQKRKQLFALGTNNAILEFLLDGTPQVKEHLHDSRKDVDRQLKTVCEQFIRDATRNLIGPVTGFLEEAQSLLKRTQNAGAQSQQQQQSQQQATNINYALRQAQWASPQQISGVVQESQRQIKSKLPALQRSMQLYLSNKDTEFILFRPIRNNIISAFVKMEQVLTTNGYSTDDLIIASCPSADQISVLLSSASMVSDGGHMPTISRKISTASSIDGGRKISQSSVENDRVPEVIATLPRKISSSDKKVSFDEPVFEHRYEEETESEVFVASTPSEEKVKEEQQLLSSKGDTSR